MRVRCIGVLLGCHLGLAAQPANPLVTAENLTRSGKFIEFDVVNRTGVPATVWTIAFWDPCVPNPTFSGVSMRPPGAGVRDPAGKSGTVGSTPLLLGKVPAMGPSPVSRWYYDSPNAKNSFAVQDDGPVPPGGRLRARAPYSGYCEPRLAYASAVLGDGTWAGRGEHLLEMVPGLKERWMEALRGIGAAAEPALEIQTRLTRLEREIETTGKVSPLVQLRLLFQLLDRACRTSDPERCRTIVSLELGLGWPHIRVASQLNSLRASRDLAESRLPVLRGHRATEDRETLLQVVSEARWQKDLLQEMSIAQLRVELEKEIAYRERMLAELSFLPRTPPPPAAEPAAQGP